MNLKLFRIIQTFVFLSLQHLQSILCNFPQVGRQFSRTCLQQIYVSARVCVTDRKPIETTNAYNLSFHTFFVGIRLHFYAQQPLSLSPAIMVRGTSSTGHALLRCYLRSPFTHNINQSINQVVNLPKRLSLLSKVIPMFLHNQSK